MFTTVRCPTSFGVCCLKKKKCSGGAVYIPTYYTRAKEDVLRSANPTQRPDSELRTY